MHHLNYIGKEILKYDLLIANFYEDSNNLIINNLDFLEVVEKELERLEVL